MSGDTFIKNTVVIDEWTAGGERFRLVNHGAGQDELQVRNKNLWRKERKMYQWAILTSRIKWLKEILNRNV